MANLVTITRESRLILKIGGIISGIILLLYILIQGGNLIRNVFFPKPPPPPAQKFGRLPHIKFPEQNAQVGLGVQFTVNTVDGTLPILSDRANVYKLVMPEPNLLALETTRNTIDSNDFVENQTKVTDTLYRWTQARTGVVLEYDIVSKNFTISSNFLTNPFLASTTLLPDKETIMRDVNGFLESMDANTTNIDLEKTKIDYMELRNGVLIPAENLGNARFARITLEQIPVEEIPIIYENPTTSLLTFIISYPGQRFHVVDGNFYNNIVDLNQKSDYPIKTAEQALEDLKNGNAYMINPQNKTDIDITNVELRYYLGRANSEYLLPVIVFTGIDFTGYVEAIPATSLSN